MTCSGHVLKLGAVRCAGSRHGGRLFDDALELVDNLGCDLVPKKTSGVDLGSRVALILLAHGGEGLGKVAAVRGLRARRERVAEVVAGDAIPLASKVHRGHAVVLRRGDGEELLVLLVLCGSGKMRVQLVEVRARDASEFRAGHGGLGPGHAGGGGLHAGDVVGNDALLVQGGGDTSVLEDAIENGSRGSANLIGHARNGRSGVAGLACDECTTEEEHKKEAGGNRLLLVLGTGDEGQLLGLGRCLLIGSKVVDEDVVVPVAVAHVEVVHLGRKVGKGGAGCSRHAVASRSLEALGENGDLLAKLARLERVVAYKLLLVELQLVDHVVQLHGLAMPVLFLRGEGLILDAHASKLILHATDLLHPDLLLFFKLLGVLLLSLPGVKSSVTLANE